MPPFASASSNPALDLTVGAGEGAALVAEELALEQRVGKSGAVDRHDRPCATVVLVDSGGVDRPRHELLARAALAGHQDGTRHPGDTTDALEELADLRRRAEDLVALDLGVEEPAVLLLQALLVLDQADDAFDLAEEGRDALAETLAAHQKVGRASAHRLFGDLDVAPVGHRDDGQVAVDVAYGADHLEPPVLSGARHAVSERPVAESAVTQDHIDRDQVVEEARLQALDELVQRRHATHQGRGTHRLPEALTQGLELAAVGVEDQDMTNHGGDSMTRPETFHQLSETSPQPGSPSRRAARPCEPVGSTTDAVGASWHEHCCIGLLAARGTTSGPETEGGKDVRTTGDHDPARVDVR